VLGNGHAGCGKRSGETGRPKDRNRAPGRFHHRLFSRITTNWRGRPLETYQTIVNLIANTTTTTGLTVQCQLDPNLYPTKLKLTDAQKKAIPITRHHFHGEWNYTIHAQRPPQKE
jgi:hypothetical protein